MGELTIVTTTTRPSASFLLLVSFSRAPPFFLVGCPSPIYSFFCVCFSLVAARKIIFISCFPLFMLGLSSLAVELLEKESPLDEVVFLLFEGLLFLEERKR